MPSLHPRDRWKRCPSLKLAVTVLDLLVCFAVPVVIDNGLGFPLRIKIIFARRILVFQELLRAAPFLLNHQRRAVLFLDALHFARPARIHNCINQPHNHHFIPCSFLIIIFSKRGNRLPQFSVAWAQNANEFSGQPNRFGVLLNEPRIWFAYIVVPSRWIASHTFVFLPILAGTTRQIMMKGVPSFL